MFTEQPAPPQPPAHVQVLPDKSAAPQPAPSPAPIQRGVAAPESISIQPSNSDSVSSPEPVQPPTVTSEPNPVPSRAAEVPSSPSAVSTTSATPAATAKAQRQQEIEQTLIKLTNQARAKQKEQEQRQAALDAAKYLEAGEVEQAQQATSKLTLPEDVKAKLQKKIAEAQAQKGKKSVAKGTKSDQPQTAEAGGADRPAIAPGYAALPGGYSTQPILPSMPIGLPLPFAKLMGKGNFNLTFPLGIIAPMTSAFGWRIHPIDGTPRFHRGIDFGAPYGSPVVAAKTGVVEAAGYIDGYGLTVILRHNNQQTLYAHMSQVFVKAGDTLKQGQLLGQVGSTGNSTGPHLHFEVHQLTDQGWVALDPAAVMNEAMAIAQKTPANPFNGQIVNLSATGLLDLNSPGTEPSDLNIGSTLLSSLLSSTPAPQAAVRIPFTLVPPVIPEFGWLISPIVENLLADQGAYIFLPGLTDNSQTVSFQSLPALNTKPIESVASNPWTASSTKPPQVQLAASQPLNRLSIAETMPGAVNVATTRQPTVPRRTRVAPPAAPLQVAQSFKLIQVTEQGLQSLKLDTAKR